MNNKTGFGFLIVFTLLSACAGKSAPGPLDGRWELAAVECKDHQPGKLARDDRRGIKTKTLEEFLVISGGQVQQHFFERKSAENLSAYCETIYSLKWTLSNGVIHSSGSTFQSREGKGGYQCYEPFPRGSQPAMPDLPYRIENDRLITSYHDIRLKDRKGHLQYECKTGSDIDHIYQRQ